MPKSNGVAKVRVAKIKWSRMTPKSNGKSASKARAEGCCQIQMELPQSDCTSQMEMPNAKVEWSCQSQNCQSQMIKDDAKVKR